jgi:hypothetical protein
MNTKRVVYILLCSIIIISISIYKTQQTNEQIKEKMTNMLIKNRKMPNQIDLLTYSDFKPECCPSTYTSSSGCLCNNYDEKLAIETRGGNRLV